MKIITDFPPNIIEIRRYLRPDPEAIFAWQGIIYNPSGLDIPEDVLYHENVHFEQQSLTTPEQWWGRYLFDPQFREVQELEAYAKQYLFLAPFLPGRAKKEVVHSFAETLERMYNLGISIYQAETKLRHAIKKYGT